MMQTKKVLFVLISLLIVGFATVYLFKGCGHQSEQSLKQFLAERKEEVIKVRAIKRRLFQKYDSIGSFTVEYTGSMFRLSFRRYDAATDQGAVISYFLSSEEETFLRSFMSQEDIYYLFLYRNRETYSFVGYDCMDITDGTYQDEGIEIAKNVYFRPWSTAKAVP